jgi:hypothetical protein
MVQNARGLDPTVTDGKAVLATKERFISQFTLPFSSIVAGRFSLLIHSHARTRIHNHINISAHFIHVFKYLTLPVYTLLLGPDMFDFG